MYEHEKKIAQMERKNPQITYNVKAFPTSKAGELAFSTAETNKYQEVIFPITFYYKDPEETEEERLKIVREKIPQILGRKRVAGFNDEGGATYLWSFDQLFSTGQMGGRHNNIQFKEDWDYKIEKVEYEDTGRLTAEGINTL